MEFKQKISDKYYVLDIFICYVHSIHFALKVFCKCIDISSLSRLPLTLDLSATKV